MMTMYVDLHQWSKPFFEKKAGDLNEINLGYWSCRYAVIKACVHYFLLNFYFSPNDSPSKILKDYQNLTKS